MSDLRLWRSQELTKLKQDMDCMFDNICAEFGLPPLCEGLGAAPNLSMRDNGDILIVSGSISGLQPDDLEISVTEKTLSISGKTECETSSAKEIHSFPTSTAAVQSGNGTGSGRL